MFLRHFWKINFVIGSLVFPYLLASQDLKSSTGLEKTAFQTSSPWMPEIDVRADVAIVYGVNGNPTDGEQELTFEERLNSWKERGYNTHFMTGIAWGSYQDYFLGKWDGLNHLGEGQVQQNGDTIWHGHHVPYIVPTKPFIEYFKKEIIQRVIDAGVSSIYLEEPEFWSRAGYGSAFKKEWKKFYGTPWSPQHESAENTYLSNKLKYQLYYEALKEVSGFAKAYGARKGLAIKIYIPTHSLVNYAAWQIVSPEASLAALPGIDGYVAQVWTGTSREPVYYNGLEKERVLENAFLEYGSMVSMTAPTKRKLFFLTDPIEDRKKDWVDYKRNYEATFVAQLLHPQVANYEVMPWPERIYTKPYRVANSDEEVLIPKFYATQMQVMINALNEMPEQKVSSSATGLIGVLMSNSLMFQRYPTHKGFDDPRFSNFYGQTLPLLKRGIPVQTVHMENLGFEASLRDIDLLVMSYSNMKPHSESVHKHLAAWVKEGGTLLYISKDDDPFQSVREWWNTGEYSYDTPIAHLFELFQIDASLDKEAYEIGNGTLRIIRQNPKDFVMRAGGDKKYIQTVEEVYSKVPSSKKINYKNHFILERGPYDIVAVLDESVNKTPFIVEGPVIDLFDNTLPILNRKSVAPGEQAFLYNVNRIKNTNLPQVLATAARVSNEEITDDSYRFVCKSPMNTQNSMRVFLPERPTEVQIFDPQNKVIDNVENHWHQASRTLYLAFKNNPDGVNVRLSW